MQSKKDYTQAIDAHWKTPEGFTEVDGKLLPRNYEDEKRTASELLASEEWKLPALMVMNDGSPVTAEKWPQRRKELLDTVMSYGFGITPEKPEKVDAEILYSSALTDHVVIKSYGGKAVSERIMLSFDAPYGRFSFPIQLVRPLYVEKAPVIIALNFRPSLHTLPLDEFVDNNYGPVEEIIDNGFAYVHLCYNDIIQDGFKETYKEAFVENGMGAVFCKGEKRGIDEWGKVGMWAYGASRVVDYLLTRDEFDHDCICVAGHSRLGKTALWCGAVDDRIFASMVNCSGFGGAGLMRGLPNRIKYFYEKKADINWWCERVKEPQYLEDATRLPYDSHFIIAAFAPRYISLVAADGDTPRYQLADFMAAAAASPAFEVQGLKGLVSDDMLPHPTVVYNEGHIGFALRPGSHYFSRWDWNRHMEFVLKHRKKNG